MRSNIFYLLALCALIALSQAAPGKEHSKEKPIHEDASEPDKKNSKDELLHQVDTPQKINDESKCTEPFTKLGDQCLYFATYAEESFHECKQLCHVLGGELVTIETATQLEAIINNITDTGFTNSFWIDGSDEVEEGKWINYLNETLQMGTPFWAATETFRAPSGYKTKNCAAITWENGYLISDEACTDMRSPICEETLEKPGKSNPMTESPPTITCPLLYTQLGDDCYAFLTWIEVPWNESRQVCDSVSGTLAVIDNIENLRAIYEYVNKEAIDMHSYWVGGILEKELWTWNNSANNVTMGTPFWGNSDTPGLPSEPDGGGAEKCIALTSGGRHFFRDKDCGVHFNPLCVQKIESSSEKPSRNLL